MMNGSETCVTFQVKSTHPDAQTNVNGPKLLATEQNTEDRCNHALLPSHLWPGHYLHFGPGCIQQTKPSATPQQTSR